MNAKRMLPHVALLLLLPGCGAGTRGGPQDPWRDLDLAETRVEGVRLRYEKALEPRIDAIRAVVADFLAAEAGRSSVTKLLHDRPDEIIDQVNAIVALSPSDRQKAEQRKMVSTLLRIGERVRLPTSGGRTTFYLMLLDTVKDHLRKGGKLPGVTYDRAKDLASYKFHRAQRSGEPDQAREVELFLPVFDVDKPEEALSEVLGHTRRIWGMTSGAIVLHELAEVTMLKYRLRPRDLHWRWFTDGFANAITLHILRSNGQEKAAAEYARALDAGRYADIEGQINLQYWLPANLGLVPARTGPLESENRLDLARYAFATHEAVRLVDKHGIGCVARILDKATAGNRRVGRQDLLAAVKEATGEDMAQRLLRYQPFETWKQAAALYEGRHDAAMKRKDYAAALTAVLRGYEIRQSENQLLYTHTAYLLFKDGHEAAADRLILDRAAICMNAGMMAAHAKLHRAFVVYAWACANPAKAAASADIVLAAQPDYPPALGVHMLALVAADKPDEARQVARRILELEKDPGSPWRRAAKRQLAGAAERPRKQAQTRPAPAR